MIIRIDNSFKPKLKVNSQFRKTEGAFTKDFEDIFFSSVVKDEEIEETSKKLDELEERLKREFSSQIVDEYKELIRVLIKKLNNLTNIVEKSSLRSKDKRLKVIVFADGKLKEFLERLLKEHITKATLMNISTELKGIIMSILA